MQIYLVKVGMMQCNCYLMLSEQKNAAVIDPGGQPDKLIEMAKELGEGGGQGFKKRPQAEAFAAVSGGRSDGGRLVVCRSDCVF